MAKRPYFKFKILKLRDLVSDSAHDENDLRAIAFELTHRNTPSAKRLAVEVAQRLEKAKRRDSAVRDQGSESVTEKQVQDQATSRPQFVENQPITGGYSDYESRKQVDDPLHRPQDKAVSAELSYPLTASVPRSFIHRLIGRRDVGISRLESSFRITGCGDSTDLPLHDIGTIQIIERLLSTELVIRSQEGDSVLLRIRKLSKKYALHAKSSCEVLKDIDRMAAAAAAFKCLLACDDYVTSRALGLWHQSASAGLDSVLSIDLNAVEEKLRDILVAQVELAKSWKSRAIERNDQFVSKRAKGWASFFNELESNPLTSQQVESILRDDTHTLVVAGAGTGKTSAVVGKIGYLVESNTVESEEILALAYNKDAANEMRERVRIRTGHDVEIRTFHSFGYQALAKHLGTKLDVADTATDDKSRLALLSKLLIELFGDPRTRASVLDFVVFHRYPARYLEDFSHHGDYLVYLRKKEPRSLHGELLKSFEELLISDWLTLNGISYEYEAAYEYVTASKRRRQYKPDFYLKDYGIYLEHFGVGKSGATAPGIDREKYHEGIQWKRELHKKHGTVLLETYSWERQDGILLDALEDKLSKAGVEIRPLCERQLDALIQQREVHEPLVDLLDRFLAACREGMWTDDELRNRASEVVEVSRSRANAFLDLFIPLKERFSDYLQSRHEIDFTDMISRLVELLEGGHISYGFKRIIVDEYQDLSRGRQRILKALLGQTPDTRIMCVGDDWQSIYGFSGSDIRMTIDFESHYGECTRVDLDRTFRFTQPIMDVSARFVQANPTQLRKRIESRPPELETSIELSVAIAIDDDQIRSLLHRINGVRPQHADWDVLFLGRYRHTEPSNLEAIADEFPGLTVRYLTVHRSKGLEADAVVVLDLKAARYGFPSEVESDDLLNLVLPGDESYAHAEERRLFYVAITRAKSLVLLVANTSMPSEFTEELAQYPEVAVSADFSATRYQCPDCHRGRIELTRPNRKKGYAWQCSMRPYCGFEAKYCKECQCAPAGQRDGKPQCMADCTQKKAPGDSEVSDHQVNRNLASVTNRVKAAQRLSAMPRSPLSNATDGISDQSVHDAINAYAKALVSGNRGDAHVSKRRHQLRRLAHECDWNLVSDIDLGHFASWAANKNLADRTIGNYRDSLCAFIKWSSGPQVPMPNQSGADGTKDWITPD